LENSRGRSPERVISAHLTSQRNEPMLGLDSSWRRSYAFVAFSTIAIVAAADFLLYDHALGWTAAGIAAVMFAAVALRNTRFLRTTGGRVFAVLMLGLRFALAEEPTWLTIAYAL